MEENKKELSFTEIIVKLLAHKRRIIIITSVITIIGGIYVVSLPRYYKAQTKIAIENKNRSEGFMQSGLEGIMALSGGNSGIDGVTIYLAPTIISSTPFMLEFTETTVELLSPSGDTPKELSLKEYLMSYQKKPWWSFGSGKVSEDADNLHKYELTKSQKRFIKKLSSTFDIQMESKSKIITLSATTQDPLVSAILADSLAFKLQQYLTEYQTRKARQEFEYAERVAEQARLRYYELQEQYSSKVDRNRNISTMSAKADQDRLMNDMNIALQAYRTTAAQLEQASTKLLEGTPVYTTIDPPVLDKSASAPSRKLIVIVSFIIGLFISAGSVLTGDILRSLMPEKTDK